MELWLRGSQARLFPAVLCCSLEGAWLSSVVMAPTTTFQVHAWSSPLLPDFFRPGTVAPKSVLSMGSQQEELEQAIPFLLYPSQPRNKPRVSTSVGRFLLS